MALRFFILILTATLMACSTVEESSKKISLDQTLKAYEHEVRWGSIAALTGYLKPDLLPEQPPLALDVNNIRVTNYEIISPPYIIAQEPTTAVQTVKIDYLFKDRQVIRHLTDHQSWEYDESNQRWWRSNFIPSFESL